MRKDDENGLVVQLVRTLACHARGRGFESHPGRHLIEYAAMAQEVERILGKDEVTSSTLVSSSRKKDFTFVESFFQLNPPLRVGEILLRNVKSSLRSGEIAAAVGGFNSTFCVAKDFTKGKCL